MKSRRPKKITNRISSVTNGFVQAIIPIELPTEAQTSEALAVLGMTLKNMSCVYCGEKCTDWDHLQPLVQGKKPSGYLHEARNLVPCCGPCNQSKSGTHWKKWLGGKSTGAKRVRDTSGLDARIKRLEVFEQWAASDKLLFQQLVGPEKWNQYWSALQEIEDKMRSAQLLAEEIRLTVEVARKVKR